MHGRDGRAVGAGRSSRPSCCATVRRPARTSCSTTAARGSRRGRSRRRSRSPARSRARRAASSCGARSRVGAWMPRPTAPTAASAGRPRPRDGASAASRCSARRSRCPARSSSGPRSPPGHTVLEVAAGLGDTGLLAAELVQPGGSVLITDGADAMVEAARAHAEAMGADERPGPPDGGRVARRPDGVPRRDRQPLGLHAARRPGGRAARGAARAAAGRADRARRVGADRREPVDRRAAARAARPRAGDPAGARDARDVRARRAGRGRRICSPPRASPTSASSRCDFSFAAESLDAWWDQQLAVSISLAAALGALTPGEHYALRDAVDSGYAPYVAGDGSVALPACALVAWAEA